MAEFDIKKAGLEVSEDLIKAVITKVVKPYAQEYIVKSENKIDDILLPFIESLEKTLLELADKIDGEVG